MAGSKAKAALPEGQRGFMFLEEQAMADRYGSLQLLAKVNSIIDDDARGFFDLLREHIARLS